MARLEVVLPSAVFPARRRRPPGRLRPQRASSSPAAFSDIGKLLARSQDLRVFVLAGKLVDPQPRHPGFRRPASRPSPALLAEHWDEVHPRAEDGDFIMREVALQSLDELPTVVLPLQHAPLLVSRRIGPLAFRSQLVASGETKLVEGEQHPEAERDPGGAGARRISTISSATLGHVRALSDALGADPRDLGREGRGRSGAELSAPLGAGRSDRRLPRCGGRAACAGPSGGAAPAEAAPGRPRQRGQRFVSRGVGLHQHPSSEGYAGRLPRLLSPRRTFEPGRSADRPGAAIDRQVVDRGHSDHVSGACRQGGPRGRRRASKFRLPLERLAARSRRAMPAPG